MSFVTGISKLPSDLCGVSLIGVFQDPSGAAEGDMKQDDGAIDYLEALVVI